MFNRGELKFQARQQLKGEYWPALFITLITFFFISSFQSESSIPFTAFDLLLFVLNLLFDFSGREVLTFILLLLFSLFIGFPILVGRARYFLSSTEGQWCLKDLFFPFTTKMYWGIVLTMLICGSILLASVFIPLGLGLFFIVYANFPFRGTMIFFGGIATITFLYFIYNYRFIPYILADYSKVKVREALKQSFSLKNERKWTLFFFDLSFSGWYIVGSIFFGVGFFLVIPYHLATTARLYLELKQQLKDSPKKLYETKIDIEDFDRPVQPFVSTQSSAVSLLYKGLMALFLFLFVAGMNGGLAPMGARAQENVAFVEDHMELLEEIEAGAHHIAINRDIFLESPIEITHDITLTGTGTIFVDGDFLHFIVREKATLTLEGELTITGRSRGGLQQGGGVLVDGGTFTLFGGELLYIDPFYVLDEEETAHLLGAVTLQYGGQFYMYEGYISNSNRHGVLVSEGSQFTMHGGEIRGSYSRGVAIEKDGEFILNDGLISNNSGGLLIQNSGTAHIYGGSIEYNGEGESEVQLPGLLRFTNGTLVSLAGIGGGVHMDGADTVLNLHGGYISHNTANEGGGIFTEGTLNMYGGTISGNIVTWSGGGVYSSGIFNMHGGTISQNLAYRESDGGGGGVYTTGRFNIFEGLISHNKTGYNGAGVFVRQGQIRIHGGEISYNQPSTAESRIRGGAIQLDYYSSLHMYDGIIRENSASIAGGICIGDFSTAVIHGGQIIENRADSSGGGISLSGFDSTLAVTGGRISGNVAYGSGGGIHSGMSGNFSSAITITGGELTNNAAYGYGGAINIALHCILTVGPDAIFSGNVANHARNIGLAAGGERYPYILWYGDNSLPGTHLLNNYDVSYEGRWQPSLWQMHLILVGLAILVMIACTLHFHMNRRKQLLAGLGLFLLLICLPVTQASANESVVVADENSLREALDGPDATVIVNQTIYINDVIEINTHVTLAGSGTIKVSDNHRHFHVSDGGKLTLEGELTLTRADGYTGYGGGIEVEGILQMNGGNISGNHAGVLWSRDRGIGKRGLGGGIDIRGRGTFYMNGGIIHNNIAVNGGGVKIHGTFHMNGGTISENVAELGGGVYVWSGDFYLNDGVISDNRSNRFGGGIAITEYHARMTMNGGKIAQNHADDHGGGIYFDGFILDLFEPEPQPRLTITDGIITENSAGIMGGGLFLNLVIVRLEGGKIVYNQAAGHGGIYSCRLTDSALYMDSQIVITSNYPTNHHEQPANVSIHMGIITLDAFRFAALLLVAGMGTFLTIKKRKRNTT